MPNQGGETREREKGLESMRGEERVCQVRCCVSLMTESQAKPQSMSINNPGWGRRLSDETEISSPDNEVTKMLPNALEQK